MLKKLISIIALTGLLLCNAHAAELFSEAWMKGYMEEWNKESALADALAKINFSAKIGYGFVGEDNARSLLTVENGIVVLTEAFNGQELNWDLRASKENWEKWLNKEMRLMNLSVAYTAGKLKFKKGDFARMIKDPRLAMPFVKSFTVMGRVPQ